jgi:hypothetical protein
VPVVPFLPAIATVGAAAIGASAQKGAAKTAARSQAQVANQNNALQREIYNRNTSNLTPYMQAGTGALGAQQALLGLGGDPAAQANAFRNYRDSTGYQFQFDQGMNALDSQLASGNRRLSGSAAKAALRYGEGIGNNAFGDYYSRLSGLAGQGFGAGSALSGVGQGYANAVGANNQNAADARSNAALYNGNVNASLWGGVGTALGNAFGQSSYQPAAAALSPQQAARYNGFNFGGGF